MHRESHKMNRLIRIQSMTDKSNVRRVTGQIPENVLLRLLLTSLLGFSQTPANSQSKNDRSGATGWSDLDMRDGVRSFSDDCATTWLTRFSKAGMDFGFLVAPPARPLASAGILASFATGFYFVTNRPQPTECSPPQLDKWQHCYVGCEISSWCPIGATSASLLAFIKEIWDSMGHGECSWADIRATLTGIWDCPAWESCEDFCCQQFR